MDAGDPRRVGAIYFAAELWALDAEIAQDVAVDASRDVAAGSDWARTARRVADRREFVAAHPWALRVTT